MYQKHKNEKKSRTDSDDVVSTEDFLNAARKKYEKQEERLDRVLDAGERVSIWSALIAAIIRFFR
jgi:hypothetical protein